MTRETTKARDEVRPVDPVKAVRNWRRRGFTDREIAEAVRHEELSAFGRHPLTAEGCSAILRALGDR